MQLYSHTQSLITISVCMLRVNTRRCVKNLYTQRLVLGSKWRKYISSRIQLCSHKLTLITISVWVLRVNTGRRMKNQYPKRLVLGPKYRKSIWSKMQLYSQTLSLITIRVFCVACKYMPSREKPISSTVGLRTKVKKIYIVQKAII
jgi:hypothetical protein